MQSRTSFFNKTLFLKTIKRFWPVWVFYFGVWFTLMPLALNGYNRSSFITGTSIIRQILSMAQDAGPFMGFAFGCLGAMAVWSFMYNFRSVSGTVSLPISREALFITLTLAGIVPMLFANVLIFLCTMLVELIHGAVHMAALLSWLGMVSLQLVFFYGFAVFCAQLTGNIIVLPCVYAVLNFTAYVVESLCVNLAGGFVYGISSSGSNKLLFLSPLAKMVSDINYEPLRTEVADGGYQVYNYVFTRWDALIAYAVVGIALTVLALLLFKARRMETAGDVVAVKVLKPVFKYCMSFGCALVLGFVLFAACGISTDTGNDQRRALMLMFLFMAIGSAIGCFGSEMLMQKSFRVFKRGWAGFGISLVCIAALLLGMEGDVIGYERYVPSAEEVETVLIRCDGVVRLEEGENIADALALHESVIANKNIHENMRYDYNSGVRDQYLRLEYSLKDGSTVKRNYYLKYNMNDSGTYGDTLTLQNLINTEEAIAYRKKTAFEFTESSMVGAAVRNRIRMEDEEKLSGRYSLEKYDSYEYYGEIAAYCTWNLTAEETWELWSQCIVPDMEDGTIGRVWLIADDEYRDTVYSSNLDISAKIYRDDYIREDYAVDYKVNVIVEEAMPEPTVAAEPGYVYDDFNTTPTKDSVRTTRWLKEHGIILYTVGEVEAMDRDTDAKYIK